MVASISVASISVYSSDIRIWSSVPATRSNIFAMFNKENDTKYNKQFGRIRQRRIRTEPEHLTLRLNTKQPYRHTLWSIHTTLNWSVSRRSRPCLSLSSIPSSISALSASTVTRTQALYIALTRSIQTLMQTVPSHVLPYFHYMHYNFVADSFHTKKLCSRLSSNEVWFYTEYSSFTVLSPSLRGLGATYDDHLRLIGVRVVDFLLVLIELFR